MNWRKVVLAAVATLSLPLTLPGQEPGWSGQIIAFGPKRAEIRSTDILHRPYRPLHFYGNAVRRRHYRGSMLPRPRDLAGGAGAVILR